MALIDDPKAWIIKMFEMESHEGRGEFCDIYPSGCKNENFEMDSEEYIYGTYKDKYFFSPKYLFIKEDIGSIAIRWGDISKCTSIHGDGKKTSQITLTNGKEINIKISDFVKGHSGRISQLYHQMIETWGSKPSFGVNLMTLDEFFNSPIEKYSFAPNLEPHLELSELKDKLNEILARPDIIELYINVIDFEGNTPISDSVVLISHADKESFNTLVTHLGADGIINASKSITNHLDQKKGNAWMIVWD